jgi:hypothetical protein
LSLLVATRALEILYGVSLLVQTLEYLALLPLSAGRSIWDWSVQRSDILHTHAIAVKLFDSLLSPRGYKSLLLCRLALGIWLMIFGLNLGVAWILWLSNLLMLIRWRGAFNGGSDFMTLVVSTAMAVGQTCGIFWGNELAQMVTLWYVCIHSISSYFLSGWVKLLSSTWRRGICLPIFLNTGVFGPLPAKSAFNHPLVKIICSWAFILWEASMPLALLSPWIAWIFCAVALLFHFLVFWFFGLNRFFWAWAATLPAVLFASTWSW